MTTRLATLKASAELDASKYVAGARQVDEAGKRMASSQTQAAAAMSKTEQRTYDSARAFDKFRASVDPAYRAQIQLEQGAMRARLAMEKGQITAAEYSRTVGLLEARSKAAAVSQGAVAGSIGGMVAQYKALAIAAGAAIVAIGVREYIQAADAMTNYASRIKLVAGSIENAADVQQKLLELANRTRVGLDGVVTLYARLGRSADALGVSQERLLGFVETFSQALKISGASSAEASSTVLQLSQSLASGYLRGAELNAVLEAGGRAAQALADGLGVPIGKLKALGEAGALESKVVIQAIESQSGVIQSEFGEMQATVGDALTVVNNNFLGFIGKVDKAAGASKELATSISDLGATLNDPQVIEAGVATVKGLVDAFSVLAKVVTGAYLAIKDLSALLGTAGSMRDFKFGGLPSPAAVSSGVSSKFFYNSSAPGVTDAVPASSLGQAEAEEKAVVKLGLAKSKVAKSQGKSDADRAKSLQEYLKGLEQEADLSSLNTLERRKQEALLKAQEIVGRDLVKAERERVVAAIELVDANRKVQEAQAEQAAALEESKRAAEEFNDDLQSGIADTLFKIFDGGRDGFKSMLKDWKRYFLSLSADIASKVLSPVIAPILQQSGLAGIAGGSGGLGANFGAGGVGGVGSLGASLGSLGKSIDQFARDFGLQKGGATGPFADGTGLFGTGTALSDVAGGALSGIGTGGTVAALTGGNALGGSVGGLVGGALGSFLGPIGTLVGSALGGFIGGLFGPAPTNASAVANFDKYGGTTYQSFEGKTTAETSGAVRNAAEQIQGGLRVLEAAGLELTDRVQQIVIGSRDNSAYTLSDGVVRRSSAVGDPNELALTVVRELAYSAKTNNADLRQVLGGNQFASLEELTNAVDFVKNVYGAITEARRPLTQVEQAMHDLTDGFKTARKEAERLGLSLEKFDAGARATFNQDIADQILSITDPVAASLAEFERSAVARLEVAKSLGADLVAVEKLNALERSRVLAQAEASSISTLKSLVDDLQFGNLSSGVAPSEQYFAALSSYNDARRSAEDLRTPEAIAGFDQASRALLPVAQSFLGVSERYADLRSEILTTARNLGSTGGDASAALLAATVQGSNAVVEQVKANTEETKQVREELRRQGAFLQAILSRKA